MRKFVVLFIVLTMYLSNSVFAQQRQEFFFDNGVKASFVTDDGKLAGVEDARGKLIIPKIYGKVSQFGNIICCYGRQGAKHSYDATIYDFKGNEVIPESAGYANWKFVKRNGVLYGYVDYKVVIDENGKFLYKYKKLKDAKGFPYLINEIADTIVIGPGLYSDFEIHDYITTSIGSRKGICDFDGTEIIPATQYSKVETDNDGFMVYNGTSGYLDGRGKVIIPTGKYNYVYSLPNGVFEVQIDGKAGIIDSIGNVKFMSKYQVLNPQKDEKGDWFYVSYLGNAQGKMSVDGKVIQEPITNELTKEKDEKGFKYVEVLGKNGMLGVKDATGKLIIPIEYYSIWYEPEIAMFHVKKRNGLCGIIDQHGKVIIPCEKFDAIYSVKHIEGRTHQLDYYKVKYNGKEGIVDITGKEVIPPMYDEIQAFRDKYRAKLDFMEGLIDASNKIIIPFDYTKIGLSFIDSNIVVELYGKKGLCSKDGSIIVPPRYTSVKRIDTPQTDGRYKTAYRVTDGETSGLYTSDGMMIFPTGLFKNVTLCSGLSERRVSADWYISAYNNNDDRHYCYDLDGVLICDFLPSETSTLSMNTLMTDYVQSNNFEKWFDEGVKEFKKKNYKKAIEYYNKSLEYRKDGNAYYNIAVSYYNMGKYKDAIPVLQTCISVSNVQTTKDDASNLIIECRECIQQRKSQRAAMWLGIFSTALNVAATVVQHNQSVSYYNKNLKNRPSIGGQFVRNTSIDLLLDPRSFAMQMEQQNRAEYLQMTNGGTTMTYEQWFTNVKGPALQAVYGTGSSSSSSSFSSSSTSSSSNYSSSSSSVSNGSMCSHCVGLGDCKTCSGRGYYYNSFDISKTVLCPNCDNHNGRCAFCHGTGRR